MNLALQIVDVSSFGPAGAEGSASTLSVLATTPDLPAVDMLDGGGGWLGRLSAMAGAPFGLDLYVSGRRGPDWRELDAFALATVYGQVIWDDRIWGWHAESGRADSVERLREVHDLALRCHRGFDRGERLILAERPC